MSLIIHRCTTCRQPDYWRDEQGRRKTAGDKVDGAQVAAVLRRTCCRRSASWGPSETAPRWSTVTFRPVTEVEQPGGVAAGAVGGSSTCNCDECWALWMQLTGASRRPRHLQAVK